MLNDYLIVICPTAIAAWPATLEIVGLSAGLVLFTRGRGGVLVVLFMLEAVTAWQFGRYM
ncbi:hypothetical protein C0Q87_04355 [Klebsiella aerogenes]|nr:hypothetical protein C0Q87_04355 [Klebsiella aerogenes]